MIKQYPYVLHILQTGEVTFTPEGDPVAPVSTFVPHAKCRDESNSGSKQINLADGTAYIFQALIQLPKGTPNVKVGTSVKVLQDADVRLIGTVKAFRQDQLHCRIWV